MTVAVVGGTGFLGGAITRSLISRREDVLQVARGRSEHRVVEGARFAAADKTDEETLVALFKDHGVSVVIDIMTLTLKMTEPLLAATARAGARYVMISAIDVTSNYGGLARLETPEIIDRPTLETDPLRKVLYPYRNLPARPAGIDPDLLRDYDKIPIEQAARNRPELSALILRLPAIFGPGDKQGRFAWLIPALAGEGDIGIDERAADWVQSFIYIDDAAEAVAKAATSGVEAQTFNIATHHYRSMSGWAEMFCEIAGTGQKVAAVPQDERGLMFERAGMMDMRYPLTLDGSKFEHVFGPVDVTPEHDAIRQTLAASR